MALRRRSPRCPRFRFRGFRGRHRRLGGRFWAPAARLRMSAADWFYQLVLEIFTLGDHDRNDRDDLRPDANVSRLQMAAFLSRFGRWGSEEGEPACRARSVLDHQPTRRRRPDHGRDRAPQMVRVRRSRRLGGQ